MGLACRRRRSLPAFFVFAPSLANLDRGSSLTVTRQRQSQNHPPDARLRLPSQFQAVFEVRKYIDGRFFRIHFGPRAVVPEVAVAEAEPAVITARLGLAVSRRADRRAVGRNRIKRLVRESFRRVRASLTAQDIVVLARAGAREAGNAALREDLARLWARLPGGRLPLSPGLGTMADSRPSPALPSSNDRP